MLSQEIEEVANQSFALSVEPDGAYNFDLIKGNFSAEAAKQVLLTLVNDKLSFHRQADFSHRERYGIPKADSLERIKALEAVRAELFELLAKADAEGRRLTLKSEVKIVLE